MKKLFLILFSIIGILSCTKGEIKNTEMPKSIYVLEVLRPLPFNSFISDDESYGTVKVIKDGIEISKFENTVAYDMYVSDNMDVYILGRTLIDGKNTSVIWKNGVPTKMDNFYASSIFTNKNKLYVSGNDVYAVGSGLNKEELAIPVLWKNGTTTELQLDPIQFSTIHSIHLLGEKTFTFGTSFDYPKGTLYWENLSAKYLKDNGGSLKFISALQDNGNTYFLGYKYFTDTTKIVYYKNGEEFIVTDGVEKCESTSICVSGNDIYIVGNKYKNNTIIATLWKNGVEQELSSTTGFAYSVCANEGDVYVAGNEGSKSVLWKNGIKIIEKSNQLSFSRLGTVIVK
jgi:sulfur transfer complex TusBCD TusB component (DsrH family)